jgi:hypothetical protein
MPLLTELFVPVSPAPAISCLMKRLQPPKELWLWLISHTAWHIANGSQRLST